MRYRRLGYRYAVVLTSAEPRMLVDPWRAGRVNVVMGQPQWRPAADVFETASAMTITVELAGVDQDDVEVMLFEDAVVIEGRRRLPSQEAGVYHAVEIRQGPFRLVARLPAPIDSERVDARFDRGLLQITLAKATERERHG